MKAFIADDSGLIRSVLRRALNELSIDDITEASDGSEAMEAVQLMKFDLIVTDWNMPGATGLQVIKSARKHGQTCPIVMQTTESEKVRVMEALMAGATDYVLKPFTKGEIQERLERFVVQPHS